jgi:hypothetical protein
MAKPKTYRVIFTATQWMRIELEARSEDAAIRKAERLWMEIDSNDPRFEQFGGEAFDDATAEEVRR